LLPSLLSSFPASVQVTSVARSGEDPGLDALRDLSRRVAMVVGFVEEAPGHRFHNAAAYLEGAQLETAKVGGECACQQQETVRTFFPDVDSNHPDDATPNWFYYWAQTPAARPNGQNIDVEYAGASFDRCKEPGVAAIFNPAYGDRMLYVCNLSKFGPDFAETYPLLDHHSPQKYLGTRTVTGIDTFAVAIVHEYQHYLDYHNWWEGKSKAQIASQDHDGDGIPDAIEPGLGFDPTKFQTYLPNDPKVGADKVGGDEEWMAYEAMRGYSPGNYNNVDWASPG
jgi:hypothetical protein